jgi:hypothetical protein
MIRCLAVYEIGIEQDQLTQRRRTAEEREGLQQRLGPSLGKEAKESCDGKANGDCRRRDGPYGGMPYLAHRAVLGIVCKLIGVEMEGLRDNRDANQKKAGQHRPAPGGR